MKDYRSDVISLWNAAADESLVLYPPLRRIFKPKLHDLIIECYSHDEVLRLLAAARAFPGEYPTGISRRAYWTAAIMFAWDTGLRRGDVWRFEKKMVQPDGMLRVVQHKTKQAVTVRLRESTRKALDAIPFGRPLAWPMADTFFRTGRGFAPSSVR